MPLNLGWSYSLTNRLTPKNISNMKLVRGSSTFVRVGTHLYFGAATYRTETLEETPVFELGTLKQRLPDINTIVGIKYGGHGGSWGTPSLFFPLFPYISPFPLNRQFWPIYRNAWRNAYTRVKNAQTTAIRHPH
jgi:hypothetical protein